jgi:hypothetical protein
LGRAAIIFLGLKTTLAVLGRLLIVRVTELRRRMVVAAVAIVVLGLTTAFALLGLLLIVRVTELRRRIVIVAVVVLGFVIGVDEIRKIGGMDSPSLPVITRLDDWGHSSPVIRVDDRRSALSEEM